MQKIGAAVGYNPAVGYATRYPDGRVYGPKIEQVADEHVYAFVQSIRTDELVYGEPGASKDVDDLAAAADELLAKLPTAVDCGAFVFQIEETFTDAPPTMVDTLGILPDVLAPVDDAVTCYTVEVTIQGPAGAIAPEGTLADASDENGKHESTPPGNNVPGGLGWLTIDRESRTVARSGLDKTAEFGKKERAWRLFVAVVEAGENGTTRADLGTALLGESNPNNLDQWKKACNEILLQLNTEVICDQRGLWRLTSF
jgi:hypothetical protein